MRNRKRITKVLAFMEGLLLLVCLTGCGIEKTAAKKIRDVKFTVIEQSAIPEELWKKMEDKKKEGFKLTYADKENLYLAVGYGRQKTGGYSISIDKCYLTKNAIYFGTTLTGPGKGEKINEVPSYPCMVVKTEYLEEPVVFE